MGDKSPKNLVQLILYAMSCTYALLTNNNETLYVSIGKYTSCHFSIDILKYCKMAIS